MKTGLTQRINSKSFSIAILLVVSVLLNSFLINSNFLSQKSLCKCGNIESSSDPSIVEANNNFLRIPPVPVALRQDLHDGNWSSLGSLSGFLDRGLCLEFGPLVRPTFPTGHVNARYIDHLSTEKLRAKYASNPIVCAKIHLLANIDYVWDGRPLPDVVGRTSKFQLVIANHVIEHVPDVITWLQDISDVLAENGEVWLNIPDKRYCFDFRRPLTSFPELVGRHINQIKQPQPTDVYAHNQLTFPVHNNATEHWLHEERGSSSASQWAFSKLAHVRAEEAARRSLHTYVDVHMSQWTPASFVEHMRLLHSFGVLPQLVVDRVQETGNNQFQFSVVLVKSSRVLR